MVDGEKAAELGEHVVEVPGLAATVAGEGIAVHGVARPHHGMPGVGDGPQQRRQRVGDSSTPIRVISVSRPACARGRAVRTERATRRRWSSGPACIRRVVDRPGTRRGRRRLARPFADPQHVRRAVVEVARDRVLPGERFLVAEDEGLVARVEVDLWRRSSRPRSMPQAAMKRRARSISPAIARSAGLRRSRPRTAGSRHGPGRDRRSHPW